MAAKSKREAFDERWEPDDKGCHIWTGATFSKRGGYGTFTHRPSGTVMSRAHRVSWELNCHEITPDQHVLHSCDNVLCVNPKHLFLGDQAKNMRDMGSKGRAAQGDRHGMFKHGRYVGQKKNPAYPTEARL